jgi:UDP-glucose 4-epimerase
MKLLVTGGAGYIGSVVTAELLRVGHDVTVFDNLSKGHYTRACATSMPPEPAGTRRRSSS